MPQLSLLDLRLAGEELGAEVASLGWVGKKVELVKYAPESGKRVFGPVMPTMAASVLILTKAYPILVKRHSKFLIFCHASLSELYEYDIPVYLDGDSSFSHLDLRVAMEEVVSRKPHTSDFKKLRDMSKATLKEVSRDSLLQKLQSAFYRIRDHEERQRVQRIVYAYLGGKRLDKDLPSFILENLKLELTSRFREAVKDSVMTGNVDEASQKFRIDRFEIAFVLAKSHPKINRG